MSRKNNIAQRAIKWLMRSLYAIGFAVVYYVLFSLFFDTPIEYELKKSTSRLRSEYNALDRRFDTLQNVYNNVSERDKEIYKYLFEAEPYSDTSSAVRRELQVEQLSQLSNHDLSRRFDKSLSRFEQRVVGQSTRMDIQREYMVLAMDEINHIPSIQPIDNKHLTLLTASYGNLIHPFYKSSHLHRGVDYSVPIGTAVFATADGVVEVIENRGQSSGISMLVKHSPRYKTFYANLDKVLIAPGTNVVRGDVIGFSGNSGLSFAPHLHYEVRQNGVAVNPLPFFFAELSIGQKAKMKRVASVGMQSFD